MVSERYTYLAIVLKIRMIDYILLCNDCSYINNLKLHVLYYRMFSSWSQTFHIFIHVIYIPESEIAGTDQLLVHQVLTWM